MPLWIVAAVALGLLAVRFPILNALAGWIVVFPILTLAGRSIAWAIVIQVFEPAYCLAGYAVTLAVAAAPTAVFVARMNA